MWLPRLWRLAPLRTALGLRAWRFSNRECAARVPQRRRYRCIQDTRLPGTIVHAYAVDSLLSAHYIRRPPAWLSAFAVFASCYILTLVAVAATAMFLSAVWLDVIYAVVATWLRLPILLGVRKQLQWATAPQPLALQLPASS
jgi:hypothetical protein